MGIKSFDLLFTCLFNLCDGISSNCTKPNQSHAITMVKFLIRHTKKKKKTKTIRAKNYTIIMHIFFAGISFRTHEMHLDPMQSLIFGSIILTLC